MVESLLPSLLFLSTLPVRGATFWLIFRSLYSSLFLSTLPVRGATESLRPHGKWVKISIHAPREGSD